MNTQRRSTVTSTLTAVLVAGVAALSACSDTTTRAASVQPSVNTAVAHVDSDNSAVAPTGDPAAVPTVDQSPPPSTDPPTVAPTTTAPTTTTPTTTTPTTTTPTTTTPTTTAPTVSPMFLTRGPMALRLSDSCYSAVWPIRVWGTVENLSPLDMTAPPVSHEFDFLLQPQNPLDVIDGGGYVRGYEGDTQMVINIHVAHFTDPAEITMPISSFNAATVYSSFPLGAVDVVAPPTTCYLTLTHYQTWVGQI